MKTLASFYDMLMPELPGVTTAMVDLHLLRVARDFCERTRALRGDFDAIDTVAGTATYDLSPSEIQSEVVQVHKLTVNAILLFDDTYFDPDLARFTSTNPDAPKYIRTDPPFSVSADLTEITLIENEIPSAAAVGGLVVYGSYKPKVNATELPDPLYSVHSEAIRAGVLGALMLMAKKPWSAAQQGVMYRSAYEQRSQFAATTGQLGNTRQRLRVRKW